MTRHHPYDDSLARFAAGRLGAGPSLVLSTHLAGCAECCARVGLFEAVGGALLDEAPARALRPDMFAAALARLEQAPSSPSPLSAAPLDALALPPWRRIVSGFQWRRVRLDYAPDAHVIMLKIAPGRKMPQHTHRGTEYTQILQGSFHDDFGRYVAGDCIEADDDVEHQPVVDSEVDCVCLAAFDGRLRLQGFFGRMMQPLMGL